MDSRSSALPVLVERSMALFEQTEHIVRRQARLERSHNGVTVFWGVTPRRLVLSTVMTRPATSLSLRHTISVNKAQALSPIFPLYLCSKKTEVAGSPKTSCLANYALP